MAQHKVRNEIRNFEVKDEFKSFFMFLSIFLVFSGKLNKLTQFQKYLQQKPNKIHSFCAHFRPANYWCAIYIFHKHNSLFHMKINKEKAKKLTAIFAALTAHWEKELWLRIFYVFCAAVFAYKSQPQVK